MAKRKKVDGDAVRAEVVNAMRAQSPTEREARVVLLWKRWEEAKAYLKKVRADCTDDLKRAQANLDDAMNEGVPVGDDTAAKRKLYNVEVAWQDVEETKAKLKDAVGGARDGVKGAFEQLSEAVQATNQLSIEYQDSAKVAEA